MNKLTTKELLDSCDAAIAAYTRAKAEEAEAAARAAYAEAAHDVAWAAYNTTKEESL